ncbi:hypothetical protein [Streptomyces sp. NBC_00887]|uniref:hypothetical protein n=1 Tax=Streptomyces sp. NBC_00887 TaxID=2975859 RepID=UPI003866B853|nr:hypothetical protein OG844_01735 [Streptomyces sp. NBC_00887]WSY36129.1 hypothetical protein OG844_43865 [Streptomyces sp. NBC_00887]
MAQISGSGQSEAGILGTSEKEDGVLGLGNAPGKAGVAGVNENSGNGVFGRGFNGLFGDGKDGNGVVGVSQNNDGVLGIGNISAKAGVAGVNDNGGNGLFGRGGNGVFATSNVAGGKAGVFDGDVLVTGDLLLAGADYAEALTAADPAVAPGTVVIVGEDGQVQACEQEYDTAVAGIVSGTGGEKPAVVLDRHDGGVAVALVGKVWCLADADATPIHPGNLLTTSSTNGHARRVTEPHRALGAIIGKALTPLASGRGLVRVLVSPR